MTASATGTDSVSVAEADTVSGSQFSVVGNLNAGGWLRQTLKTHSFYKNL